MADDRAISRGEGECGGGRAGKSGRLLFWRGWRGCLEDDGRRDGVETDLRQGAGCFDWSAGAGAVESENHLRGNGCQHDFCRQQLWRWNLQIRGWRRELAACGVGGHAAHRENPDRSTESGRRAGCGDGSQFRTERRARSFSLDGWRADVEKSFVQRQCDGGDRPLF